MKHKIFTLFFALVATMTVANAKVCVDGIWYELYADNIAYVVSPDYHGRDYKEYEGDIVIPTSINYGYGTSNKIYNIRGLDFFAFRDCRELTSVTLPDGLTVIGQEAFAGCVNLKSINIPSSVTLIQMRAFEECYSLTTVSIPSGVTTIGYNAFYGVPNIQYDGSVTDYSPWGAKSLNGYVEDHWVYADENKTKILVCSAVAEGEIIIPSTVTEIEAEAFAECPKITSLHVPSTITSFGANCFARVFNVVYSGSADLSKCGAKSINGFIDGYLVYDDEEKKQLRGCLCSAAGDIEVPNSVTSIKEYAFVRCTDITSLKIPNGVTRLGRFYECKSLNSIYIPASVISIADWSFTGCTKLNAVHISDLVAWCNIKYDVGNDTPLSMAHHLFLNGEEVTDLVIPSTITKIEADAFKGCEGLIRVTIPDNVVTIGNFAFANCTGLLSVNMGNGVQTIEEYAFSYCTKMTECTIGQNVITIREYAFDHCKALSTITIPGNVTSIGQSAFSACENLRTVFVFATNPPDILSYTFRIPNNAIFYVPYNTLEKYKTAAYWNHFNLKEFCSVERNATSTSAVIEFFHNLWALENNYIISVGIEGGDTFDGNTLEYIGLEPESEYSGVTVVLTSNTGETEKLNVSFTTTALELTTQPSKPVSSTTAILLAETNMSDSETSCGFEWRRNDAPEDMAPNKVFAPVANGTMAGRLKNLKDDVYYKYRAFYQSAAGNMYYGEWQYIFTGDVAVEFDPILYTYAATAVKESEATLKGYALAGSDDFTEQGFEYWADSRLSNGGNAPARMKADLGEHKTVTASGISMKVTLQDLDEGTVYKYRTYAKIGDKVLYGTLMSFTTLGEFEQGLEELREESHSSAHKFLRNGQLYILRDGKVYTVSGMRVK